MMNKTMTLAAAMIAAAAIGGLAAQPAEAQPYGQSNEYWYQFQDKNSQGQYQQYQDRDSQDQYRGRGRDNRFEDGYRTGYRAGYDTARSRRRYDDRPIARSDMDQRWRARYTRYYTYNDDVYYRDCRRASDPAGVIAGALIGGLVGNSVASGGARGGATVAGVIVGGALGAAMTRNLNCEDRSYAYRTYYDGFNSGRANSTYQWRNPNNGHYGNFRVVSYANDPDGFRCANYSQEIFIQGRPQTTTGRACQQPNGTWTIVG
jgi:surface antigen